MLEQLRPQPLAPFVAPVSLGDTSERLPRAYVVANEDRAIPTELQRRLVRDNPDVESVEIEADHSPFLSATPELAAALERFAGP